MELNKLKAKMEKYNLVNIIKIIILLIVLFISARIFIPNISFSNVSNLFTDSKSKRKSNSNNKIEGFASSMGNPCYGNQLTLQDPTNKPTYNGNTVIFKFDNIYKIEGFRFEFNSSVPKQIPVYIQYEDGNGSMRYIKSRYLNSSPPMHLADNSYLENIESILDENNLVVYTSKISLKIGDENKPISKQYPCGFINKFTFWGSTRDMMSKNEFEALSNILSMADLPSTSADINTGKFSFKQTDDYLIYGISISYSFKNPNNLSITTIPTTTIPMTTTIPTTTIPTTTIPTTTIPLPTPTIPLPTPTIPLPTTTIPLPTTTIPMTTTSLQNNFKNILEPFANKNNCPVIINTDSPFRITINYNNGIYLGNNFSLKQKYIIRSDPMAIDPIDQRAYIIFPIPIIANQINLTIPPVSILDNNNSTKYIIVSSLKAYGITPTNTDITNYKKTVNALLNTSDINKKNVDICPSVDDLISKQNQAQAICDNLEYQDRVKSEKVRLEKNKQYLLKLQQQQEQIDQLNTVIQTLDNKRQERGRIMDMSRLLQYQQQRETASSIRDIANQRLQSQDTNQLHMDVNINTQ